MSEVIGVNSLSRILEIGGEAATAITDKAGLFSYISPLMKLSSVNFSNVDEEIKDLSQAELDGLAKTLSDSYKPQNKVADLKLDEFISLLKRSGEVIVNGVKEGVEIYETLKIVVEDWKKVLGVA